MSKLQFVEIREFQCGPVRDTRRFTNESKMQKFIERVQMTALYVSVRS